MHRRSSLALAGAVRSLMPDSAANQPAMLARLPLQDGLDWLNPRYGSAKNTLDNAAWHHRLVLVEGRPALSVLVWLPTRHAITIEKREAYTAGLDAHACLARESLFARLPALSTSSGRQVPSASPILRRATSLSPHLLPASCPTAALYLFETPLSARHHTCDRPSSCTCRRCESTVLTTHTSAVLSRPAIHSLL